MPHLALCPHSLRGGRLRSRQPRVSIRRWQTRRTRQSSASLGSNVRGMIARQPAKLGEATLMLIEYPTPQLAAEKFREIEAVHQPATQPEAGNPSILDVAPFFDKRTGPIIVIAAGPLGLSEARSLLGSVSYEADVTWNENTYVSKKDNLANLLFNIIVLCCIVVGLALVAGLAFGGLRIIMKRLFPDRVFDRPEDRELISLRLGETLEQASRRR